MTLNTLKIAGAIILAASLIGAGANAADLRLKSKDNGRSIAKPGASKALKGNGPNLADLILKPFNTNTSGMPNTGICGNWQQGYQSVKFRVKNIGDAAAAAHKMTVVFENQGGFAGNVNVNVPAIGANQSAVVSATVPNAAQPGYSQSMKVIGVANAYFDVPEQSVDNNHATGYCHGPTT